MEQDYVTPGLMAICMTCRYQDRVKDNDIQRTCIRDHPNVAGIWCADYRILRGDYLGPRLAELYDYLKMLTVVVVALQSLVESYHPPLKKEEP